MPLPDHTRSIEVDRELEAMTLKPPTPPAPIGAATTPVKLFKPLPALMVNATPAFHDISI